ncbi:MAG: hypothetical protein RIS85_2574 [Pseudomonadota bacterium]|jgi:hypothetical protein
MACRLKLQGVIADQAAMGYFHLPPRTLLYAQALMLATVLIVTAIAPRRDTATLILPVTGSADGALAWALAHGAAMAGPGPGGSVVLLKADASLGWRALLGGAVAIRVPETLCTNASKLDG